MQSEELLFDASDGTCKTYNDLFKRINNDTYYYEIWRYPSFYDFLVNLIKALLNDRVITLIDKDLSSEELVNLGYSTKFEIKHELKQYDNKIVDKRTIIDKILNSRSLITFFTSGTTGIPKKIVHTLSTLTRMVRVGENYKNNVWAIAYNPTHMAGMQVILQALANGNRMVYLFEASNDQIKRSITERGITHISATPTFYRLILSDNTSYPVVKRITLGGEKSDAKLHKLLAISFPNSKINNIYASTELGSLFVSYGENFVVPISIASKVKVKENELLIHSSLLSWHYDDEWYPTGDIVEVIIKKSLTFKFKHRKNEMINVGGYKVNPNEVEEVIRDFPEVREVRIFGKPNSVLGNVLCADIVLNSQKQIEIKEIFKKLKNVLQEYKIPRIIKFIDKIEVTRTGKLSRK